MEVVTTLDAGTPLTLAECDQVCAAVWCRAQPISRNAASNQEGCSLSSPTTVHCTSVAYDCGYFPQACTTASCPGQCRERSTTPPCCGALEPECDVGSFCDECPAPDPRCSMANCTAFKGCGGALPTEPAVRVCADADGGIDAQLDLAQFCPDACNALHAGAVVAQCPPPGADGGVDGGSCGASCTAAREACEAQCSRASFATCMSCAAACGVAFGQCQRACP